MAVADDERRQRVSKLTSVSGRRIGRLFDRNVNIVECIIEAA